MTTRLPRRPKGARKPPRVVLDTNAVLSALVFGKGPTAQLRGAWQRGDFVPLVSTATVQELVRVLAYPKFRLDAAAQQELLADYLPHTLVVRIPEPPPAVPACRDAFDLPFLYLAAAGHADVLVSGDADLLALASQVRFAIIAPGAFLNTLNLPSTSP
ncbi:MAG: putative toxin-antitoxin system toxin component, PIN family [Burkholderiaceae bacterium]|nr:putative toxin-antitoxin system toxin component, PIN family [Burkholderiaceae bacterium]